MCLTKDSLILVQILEEDMKHHSEDALKTKSYVATHDGKFHADDVFCTMLYMLSQMNENALTCICRTRNMRLIESAKLVYDVGGVFSNSSSMYDHHQKDFTECYSDDILMSGSGLLWWKTSYAMTAIRNLLEKHYKTKNLSEKIIDKLYNDIGNSMVKSIDAFDNGIYAEGLDASFSKLISSMNRFDSIYDRRISFEYFKQSVFFAVSYFENAVLSFYNREVSKEKLEELSSNLFVLNERGDKALIMPEGMPWKEFVNSNSENLQAQGLKLVIYPSDSNKSTWKVQSINAMKEDPFTSLCPAPEELAGLREQELEEILNVVCESYDGVFVHPKRFIGGMDNYENVVALARYWVK